MPNTITPCSCLPYSSLCCCGPILGISVVQPTCQTLPDGRVVNNPSFDSVENKSYWTYKFLTDCAPSTRAISNFVIPICEILQINHISVEEKVDGCGEFVSVPFSLSITDSNYGNAPAGFQWLKVETNDRFDKGLCVEYRLRLTGNYPVAVQPIQLKAHGSILIFDCNGHCFLVPQCPPQGNLVVIKSCSKTIVNNQATLNYSVEVNNLGSIPLDNVQYQDIITYPSQLSTGAVTVTPQTLNVDVSQIGQIVIFGNLGTLNPGEQIIITYQVPITGVSVAGSFAIQNTAFASSGDIESSATCFLSLEAVQLQTDKCCIVTDDGKVTYRVHISNLGNSPSTSVNLHETLSIPAGVVVRFHDFGGCMATFEGTNNNVPINTNIEGPVNIKISCENILLPSGNIAERIILLSVVSSSVFGTTMIVNTIERVDLVEPDSQILLGVGNLPLSILTEVRLDIVCRNPC